MGGQDTARLCRSTDGFNGSRVPAPVQGRCPSRSGTPWADQGAFAPRIRPDLPVSRTAPSCGAGVPPSTTRPGAVDNPAQPGPPVWPNGRMATAKPLPAELAARLLHYRRGPAERHLPVAGQGKGHPCAEPRHPGAGRAGTVAAGKGAAIHPAGDAGHCQLLLRGRHPRFQAPGQPGGRASRRHRPDCCTSPGQGPPLPEGRASSATAPRWSPTILSSSRASRSPRFPGPCWTSPGRVR